MLQIYIIEVQIIGETNQLLDGTISDEEIIVMIDHAYDVVVAKLPKYIQQELHRV